MTRGWVVFQAPGDGDASPGAVSYIGYRALCSSNNPKPQCGRNTQIRAGSFAGALLPAMRLALPSAICKDRDIDGLGSDFPRRYQTSQCFRVSSENIGSSNGSKAMWVSST